MECGGMRTIKPYKGRTLNPTEPVEVYRCLNRQGKTFSIRQDGLVIGHSDLLVIRRASFIVSASGKNRCRSSGIRNVHAFVRGFITNPDKNLMELFLDFHMNQGGYKIIKYDAYSELGFHTARTKEEVESASSVVIKKGEVFALRPVLKHEADNPTGHISTLRR